jgi:hypothetical protein
MAITLKDAVDRLPQYQLADLIAYAQRRYAMRETNAVMADIVADNKINPVMNALPACPTEWSHTRFALWELEQQQRMAERDTAAAERTAASANGSATH